MGGLTVAKQAHRPDHSPVSKVLVAILISLLAAVTIFLIIQASKQNKPVSADTETYVPPQLEDETPNGDLGDGKKSGSDKKTVDKIRFDPIAAPTRFIELGADGQIMRGELGSCLDADTITFGSAELSVDNGMTWEPSYAIEAGATQILSAALLGDATAEMIALDQFCDPMLLRSFTAGVNWQPLQGAADLAWHFNPNAPYLLNSTLGPIDAPCEVAQLSLPHSGQNVAVLCQDSSVMSSVDGGAEWFESAPAIGAAAIVAASENLILAVPATDECAGVQLKQVALADGEADDLGLCLDVDVAAGELALAAIDNNLALWSGETLLVSEDGGNSWF